MSDSFIDTSALCTIRQMSPVRNNFPHLIQPSWTHFHIETLMPSMQYMLSLKIVIFLPSHKHNAFLITRSTAESSALFTVWFPRGCVLMLWDESSENQRPHPAFHNPRLLLTDPSVYTCNSSDGTLCGDDHLATVLPRNWRRSISRWRDRSSDWRCANRLDRFRTDSDLATNQILYPYFRANQICYFFYLKDNTSS